MEGLEDFERELAALVNRYSLEQLPQMADHVIAHYLVGCLVALGDARVNQSALEGDSDGGEP